MLLFIFLLFFCKTEVYAEETDSAVQDSSVLDSIDFGQIEESVGDLFQDYDFDFKDTVMQLVKGEIPFNMESLGEILKEIFSSQIHVYRQTLIQLLLIVLISAIFTNFSSVFSNGQAAEISFYIIYLLLFSILMKSFGEFTAVAQQTMDGIVQFMQALIPAYFLTVAFAAGGVTSAIFYQFILILILAVQWILLYIVLPAINIYVVLTLINHISKEDFLSKLAGLIKSGIEWILKSMFAAVIGINIIQGLVGPAVDAIKSTTINKTASAIPGIGNALNAVTEIILGSAVLIKNSVGVAVLIGLAFLCAGPLLKLFTASILYRFIAAAVQPIADKRMLGCIGSVGGGIALLLRVLSTTMALFMITIAMIATFTNRGY